ncbi:hypothetical protein CAUPRSCDRAFT_11366 [Caulochytrium protostelioides]|uniref:CCHC-type domain-containing protein n=1 Tax=Caulochytrium protostelioides TaxID=1555241 RepID=A0A4P9WUB4_9FUNG|nr:hypothetical protein CAUPRSCDRAFT_11366 [Caulochytrium protostelioides]
MSHTPRGEYARVASRSSERLATRVSMSETTSAAGPTPAASSIATNPNQPQLNASSHSNPTTRTNGPDTAYNSPFVPAPPIAAPVPVFTGRDAQQNATGWLKTYSSVATISGWGDWHKLNGVYAYLRDEALEWASEEVTVGTWGQFEELFKTRYAVVKGPHDGLSRLRALRFKMDGNYNEFRNQFMTALYRAGIKEDVACIGMLYEALPPALHRALIRAEPPTLSEALRVVELEQRAINAFPRGDSKAPLPAKPARVNGGRENSPSAVPKEVTPAKPVSTPASSKREVICHRCNRPGHYKFNCPQAASEELEVWAQQLDPSERGEPT